MVSLYREPNEHLLPGVEPYYWGTRFAIAKVRAKAPEADKFQIGHRARFWEYAHVIAAVSEVEARPRKTTAPIAVVDIGAGMSPLGAALKMTYGALIVLTEVEPFADFCDSKRRIYGGWYPEPCPDMLACQSLGEVGGTFDVVACVSVLEHLPKNQEEVAWEQLAARVARGGRLVVTVDVMENPSEPHYFDNLRVTNYDLGMLHDRVKRLQGAGLALVGDADWIYPGNFVHDYTFAAIVMERP